MYLVNGYSIYFSHLVELVNANHATVGQHLREMDRDGKYW